MVSCGPEAVLSCFAGYRRVLEAKVMKMTWYYSIIGLDLSAVFIESM